MNEMQGKDGMDELEATLMDDLRAEGAPQSGDGAKLAGWTAAAVAAASVPAAAAVAGGTSKGLLSSPWLAGGIVATVVGAAAWFGLAEPDPPAPKPPAVDASAVEAPAPVQTPATSPVSPAVARDATSQSPALAAPAVDADTPGAEASDGGAEAKKARTGSGRRSTAKRPAATEPGPSKAPAPETLDAAGLYARANRARRAGDDATAIADYRTLQTQFPDSRQATTSRVTLGRMLLKRGDAAAALPLFQAYLRAAPRGTMAEEARVGRADALGKLGRKAEQRAAWEELLRLHPGSVHAPRGRRVLAGG